MSRTPQAHAALLFGLNLAVVAPWLGIEYLDRMESIEGSFIAVARWWAEHPELPGWFPLWYLGIPLENAYPPLLPGLTALTASLAEISVARAYHVVSGLFYALGPPAFYWLSLRLRISKGPALLGGLALSLLSPAVVLPQVAIDNGEFLTLRRLYNLAVYGEGPHCAALTLLFFALVLLDRALEKPSPARLFAAAAGCASVALTNWLGSFALAWGAAAIVIAQPRPRQSLPWAGLTGIWAYGLALLWLPPSTIAAVRHNAQLSGSAYPMTAEKAAVLIALALATPAAAWAAGRAGFSKPVRFLTVFGPPMIGLPLAEDFLDFAVVPQPFRYQLEMEAALILAAVIVVEWVASRVPKLLLRSAWAVIALPAILQTASLSAWFRPLIRPLDHETTIEYETARRLASDHPGRRVFSSGTVRFWTATFADVPLFGGAFGQGVGFPQWWPIDYGLTYMDDQPELAVDWLRAYGVDLLYVPESDAREHFKIFANPARFHGALEEVRRDGGDVLYRIPRRGGLAHVVPSAQLVGRSPYNIYDAEPMRAYVAALESPSLPDAAFEWRTPEFAVIQAAPRPGDALSVQIAYHPRWRAYESGAELRTRADELGLLVVEPARIGRQTIELRYVRETWITVVWALSWAAGALAIGSALRRSPPAGQAA